MGFRIILDDNLTHRVYKTGFATNQAAYEETVYPLFKSLDRLEKILENKRYLIRETLTEAGKETSKGLADSRYPLVHDDREIWRGLSRWIQMQYRLNST